MKKFTLLLLVIFIFLLSGCSSLFVEEKEEVAVTTLANPWKTYESLDSAASELSFSVHIPDFSPTWVPVSYSVMDSSLLEVVFSSDTDGQFTFRMSATDDEISGDYNTYELVSNVTVNGAWITEYSLQEGTIKAASWMYEGHAYYLLFDNSQSEESFLKIVGDFVDLNKTYPY
ncbi:MAG: hypothetical protein K6F82_02300 [Sphaerochaetaceae bacterium]|nr:hypothetical protein [Sphaerochaetaceae bacterium]